MRQRHVIIVGAGIGGLMAALMLAGRGLRATVLERAATPGGKMRQMFDDAAAIDAGPTVFTLKKIFQEAFASIDLDFDACAPSTRANVLARHAWDGAQRFDLFADIDRSTEAVGKFAGAAEAEGFARFCADSQRVWRSLERSFVRAPAPSFLGMLKGAGLRGLPDLLAVSPFQTLWSQLDTYFKDPRLRQLFGRYSTYCGSSPYLAPATLMLVAHVEQDGVWMIEGGMHRLAQVIAEQACSKGAEFRYGAQVEGISRAHGQSVVTLAGGDGRAGDGRGDGWGRLRRHGKRPEARHVPAAFSAVVTHTIQVDSNIGRGLRAQKNLDAATGPDTRVRAVTLDHGGAELIGTDKRQLPVAGAGPAVFFGDHAAWGAGDARGPGGQRCERAGEAGLRRIFQQSAAREW